MTQILKPCDCEAGFCNHLPNPFIGYLCRVDETIEMSEELNKAIDLIQSLQQENEALKADNIRLRRIVTAELDEALADSPPLG